MPRQRIAPPPRPRRSRPPARSSTAWWTARAKPPCRNCRSASSLWGLLTGAADGHFGDGTEEAVKLFQQMYGLSVTGYADEATLAALSTAQEGVLEVQGRPDRPRGVSSGEADGVLGEATEEAIATFQQMFGLEATGVADPETRELLASSSNVIFGVQTKLIELAYLTGVADGVLGPATETAIQHAI